MGASPNCRWPGVARASCPCLEISPNNGWDHAPRGHAGSTIAAVNVLVDGMFEQLTLLAPGLLGGSVAKAARHRGLARRIVLWSRRPENRVRLRGQTWCDQVRDTPEEPGRGPDLV